MTDIFDSKAFLKTVTSKPGVYQMYDVHKKIIYVGKAKNLKKRVSSYFRKTGLTSKTQLLVSHITEIEITVTHTESEALLLENNLIKKNLPRYNILLRDDKSYPYIFISNQDRFPGIALHRGARKKIGQYLGPYPNAGAVRDSIKLLQRMFLIRQCEDSVFKNRSRPCLQYQIKRCTAPCVNYITEKAYKKDIEHAVLFLQGKSNQIIEDLVSAMEKAAATMNFEKAAVIRDQISQLKKVTEHQNISKEKGDIDIIACATSGGQACVQVFYVRNGLNLGNRSYFPKLPDIKTEEEILTAFIPQFYYTKMPPREIVLSTNIEDKSLLETVLSDQLGKKVRILSNVRSDKAQWLALALNNAKNALNTRLISRSGMIERFEALQETLQLSELPARLECFDISHTQGEATKASCVVFTQEGAYKNDYRRYNIKNITPGDDYGAMRQALRRRYKKSDKKSNNKEVAKQTSTTGQSKQADEVEQHNVELPVSQILPDVLFIDGGLGQLNQAIDVFADYDIQSVLLVGVAKGENRKEGLEKLVFSDGRPDQFLTIESPALHLIIQIRNEAHRFAISGHRAARAKTRNQSPLENIEGLGPKRRQSLLKHFGGIQGITRAGTTDLEKIPGISKKLAQLIYDEFHIEQ